MTLAELLTKVRVYIDDTDSETYETDTPLELLLQTAANEVSAMILAIDESYYTQDHDIGFMIQPNVELYDLPANFMRIKYVEDENGVPLYRKNVSDRYNFIGTGEVRYYYFQGSQIGFLDIPARNAVFPYKYIRTPAQMTDDDSEPDVPEFLCHDLIAVKAAMVLLGIEEDDDTWLNKQANWLLEQIKESYYRRNTDFPKCVPGDDDLELD